MFLSHIDVSVCLPLPLPLNSVNIAQLIIFFLIHRTVRQRGCVPVGRHVQAMGSFGTRGVHTVCRSLCNTVHRMWDCALTPHPTPRTLQATWGPCVSVVRIPCSSLPPQTSTAPALSELGLHTLTCLCASCTLCAIFAYAWAVSLMSIDFFFLY